MNSTDILQFSLLGLIVFLLIIIFQKIPSARIGYKKGRKLVLDTCALIDGRIIDIAKSGFVPDQLIIPKFILDELQFLADGKDAHKRERARFGLDMVRELQDSKYCEVIIDKDMLEDVKTTDEKLVVLAKKRGAQLYTTDYNLNKVADIEGVHVLNVNELAQDLRPIVLPGETRTVTIVQKGSGRDQGVGYLDDGTMVVVNGGGRKIGKALDVEVTRMHQTVAGKMIFATSKTK